MTVGSSVVARHSVQDPSFLHLDRLMGTYILPQANEIPSREFHEFLIQDPVAIPTEPGIHNAIEMFLYRSSDHSTTEMIYELCFSTPDDE